MHAVIYKIVMYTLIREITRAISDNEKNNLEISILTPGLSEGVLCDHPCPWFVRASVSWSVFIYLRDGPLVFLIFA